MVKAGKIHKLTVPQSNAYSITPQLHMSTSWPAYNLKIKQQDLQYNCVWCIYLLRKFKTKELRILISSKLKLKHLLCKHGIAFKGAQSQSRK